jgi:ADP-ribose pyrophosphatase YjhB (NUDIX family)
MDPISTLKDIDIFENPSPSPKFYVKRPTVKGMVFDEEGNIALLSVRGHSLFPGGGVEGKESLEEALSRECEEEIGCKVLIIQYLGQYDQYRDLSAKKYEIHFFMAGIIGEKGTPTTTNTSEQECVLTWESKDRVLEILEEQIDSISFNEYALQFNARTHLEAFKRFMEMHFNEE